MTATGLDAGGAAAIDRVTRTMALALGVGAVAYGLIVLPGFVAQLREVPAWWSWTAAAAVFLPVLAAAALSRVLSPRVLRGLAGATAVGHLAALATLVPVLPGGHLSSDLGGHWILHVSVIGVSAAALAWPLRIAAPYLAVCIVLLGIDRWLASQHPIPDTATQDALHSLLFDAIFLALAVATRRAGRQLDAAADAAVRETREVARADARRRERARVEALVHDTVLVALLGSARRSDRAGSEARSALARLDALARDDAPAGPVAARDWVWRVQALTTDLAPAARFSHEGAAGATLPAAVADAALEATAEALRNSVRHAGDAARAVHVRVTADGLEVAVLDDGRGFDPALVGPARLGVAVGILDRMRSLPGGDAAIASRPGVGTRVRIAWRAGS